MKIGRDRFWIGYAFLMVVSFILKAVSAFPSYWTSGRACLIK